jgi:ATP-dependent RNA helicase DDX56/DBP9
MTAMKRKLNSEDVPEVVAPEGGETPAAAPAKATFDTLNLDARILQAITREKFTEPTPVQAATLPLALNGKDILGMFGRLERRYMQG